MVKWLDLREPLLSSCKCAFQNRLAVVVRENTVLQSNPCCKGPLGDSGSKPCEIQGTIWSRRLVADAVVEQFRLQTSAWGANSIEAPSPIRHLSFRAVETRRTKWAIPPRICKEAVPL